MVQIVNALLNRSTPPIGEERTAMACYFFRLPSELKLEVLSYLESKRDLYNVSKTCRWLEDVALARLYRVIDLEIPMEKSSTWSTGGYLKLRPYVVNVIQDITIRDGIMDYRQPQFHRRRRSDAGCPESYTAEVVERIPSNQLRSFSFMHRSPVSLLMLRLLMQKHGRSLQHLSCYEMEACPIPPNSLPTNLETLECRSIDDGDAIGRLVHASKDSLHTLRLGEERALVSQYYRLRSGFYEGIPQPLHAFNSVTNLADIRSLRRLSLFGLDVGPLVPLEIEGALYFTKLKELTMESCKGSAEFLAAITSIFTFAQSPAAPAPPPLPQLEKFLFRHEASNALLKEALVQFLNSFTGLHMLSLLFENGSMLERLQNLIANHGPTLESLVLESRIQPRELLRLDTSRPFGGGGYSQQLWEESMIEICRSCPNLVELSAGFPWNDEMVRIRSSQFHTLKQLRTMHIRNFPESEHLLQMGDYSVKEYAIKFIEWTYGALQGDEQPQLETLSIGPGIYESRFKGANPSRQQAPEFLRTHHFMLDWARTRFGRWSAMITNVSERYMEEYRGEKPLGGVFQPVWLR